MTWFWRPYASRRKALVVCVLQTAVVSVGALLLRGALGVWFPTVVPFALTFPAVLASTLLCGRYAGIICLAITQIGAWYLFLPVHFSFDLKTPSDVASLVISTLSALLIIGFADRHLTIVANVEALERQDAERLAQSEARLRDLNAALESRVAQAVAESRLLADLVEGTDAGVLVIDNDYRLMAVNRAAVREFQRVYGLEPRVGDRLIDLLADRPEHQAAMRAAWARVLSDGPFAMIAEFGDPEYGQRHYDLRFDVLRDAQGA